MDGKRNDSEAGTGAEEELVNVVILMILILIADYHLMTLAGTRSKDEAGKAEGRDNCQTARGLLSSASSSFERHFCLQ